ncbi:hypothetical protein PAXRUDRAFT_167418, partial [Paxillus rubicundulus Ve08.2h10]
TTRGHLYAKFKEDDSKMWQEILEIQELIELSESPPQTVAQHAQMFNRIWKKLTTLIKGAAAKHRFEAALVMCGKIINEDVSLGFAHTTAGATNFFETHCRSDVNTMIGHLKVHI